MTNAKTISDSIVQSKPIFYAFGFDQAGFQKLPDAIDFSGFGTICFIPYKAPIRLDEADGVIVPSGIFESIKAIQMAGGPVHRVEVHSDMLIEREKQVLNLIQDGKWVCFLVRDIIDKVSMRNRQENISDTDLCKRFLTRCGVTERKIIDGEPNVSSRFAEFSEFMRQYGTARTCFNLPKDSEQVVISGNHERQYAFELGQNLFFLPFHTTNREEDCVAALSQMVTEAVVKYRQTRREDIPGWADAFVFPAEKALKEEKSKIKARLVELEQCIDGWRKHKSILASSGDALHNRLVSILRDYFGLKIDAMDDYREDAKVVDDMGRPLILLEFKAMSGGVGREDVSQINFHRDRAKLPESVPGVLIVNCNRKKTTVADRCDAQIDCKQIHYAKSMNVLVVRTIDLLCLMRQLEDKSVPERRDILMTAFLAGGGWLKATEKSYEIVAT